MTDSTEKFIIKDCFRQTLFSRTGYGKRNCTHKCKLTVWSRKCFYNKRGCMQFLFNYFMKCAILEFETTYYFEIIDFSEKKGNCGNLKK